MDGRLEVYLSHDSASAGDLIAAKVSADGPVTAKVFRLGHYGGAGARKVWSGGPYAATRQPECPRLADTALIECDWSETFGFQIGSDWVSGLYLLKIEQPDGFKRFAPLVVRDRRAAELFFEAAFNTYQAYNAWGGESLYADASGTMPSGRAHQVSYDRPYKAGQGSGQMLLWEYPLIRLLERSGYDVTYGTNLDFSRFSDVLGGIGAFAFGGHDEYWTSEERAQVDAAVSSGQTSVAHFGANAAYHRVRFLSDGRNRPLRTVVCYKSEPEQDPIPYSTVRFRDEPGSHPENLLFGTMYESWQLIPFSLVVTQPEHWLFQGTGLARGDRLKGLLGHEFDRVFPDLPGPTDVAVVMESPVVTAEGVPAIAHGVVRTLAAGNIVFSAGSIFWPLGLTSDPDVGDGRVVRMTLNVLERALKHRRAMQELPPPPANRPMSFPPQPQWVQSVSALAGLPGAPAWVDGPGAIARFSGPTGLAVLSSNQVVVADTRGNRIRLIDSDAGHTVRTIAGTGDFGVSDGPGAQARFRAPTGVVAGSAGIYVADSDNQVIRLIQLNPPTWTVSTYAGTMRSAGFADGPRLSARFKRPTAVALDAAGNLYVTDQSGQRIRMVSPAGEVSTIAGSGATGFADSAIGLQARFNGPSAIAVGPGGVLLVVDSGNHAIRAISADSSHSVSTVAGGNQPFGFADGPGPSARIRAQMGIVVAPNGDAYVADTANFVVRKLVGAFGPGPAQLYTVAGTGATGTRLGTGDQADIVAPAGLVLTSDGRLLVADSFNNVIRSIAF